MICLLIVLPAWQLNFERGCGLRRESAIFGFDDGLADGGHGLAIARDIQSHVTANVFERDSDQQVVDIIAAKAGVAVGREHLEHAVFQFEDGQVECAAAEVIDGDPGVVSQPVRP